MCAIEIF
ncbi:unnamed protein product [Larinioides sclopetarius]